MLNRTVRVNLTEKGRWEQRWKEVQSELEISTAGGVLRQGYVDHGQGQARRPIGGGGGL